MLSVGEGPGIATGIGIAFFNKEDQLIPLNGPPSLWQRLYTGPTTLHFVAKYRATGKQVTGGWQTHKYGFLSPTSNKPADI